MTILGSDLSHWQGSPYFPQVKQSGRDFVVLKGTDGTGYVDVYCNGGYDAAKKIQVPSNRAAAHAAGLIVGLYHFAEAGDPAAEAAHFLSTVGTLQPGEFLVLDWEVSASNPPAWCKAWLDAVYAATGVRPLIYMNQSAATGSNWSAVQPDYALWLAKYDNSTAQPTVPGWTVAMKQYSSSGIVPGIAGACDVDVFYGTAQQLLAYGKGGTLQPEAIDLTPEQAATLDNIAWLIGQIKPTVDGVSTALGGYGARIERIDEGLHGGWGYGARIEDIQAKVDALNAAVDALVSGGVDPTEVAKLVLAGLNGTTLNVSPPPAAS